MYFIAGIFFFWILNIVTASLSLHHKRAINTDPIYYNCGNLGILEKTLENIISDYSTGKYAPILQYKSNSYDPNSKFYSMRIPMEFRSIFLFANRGCKVILKFQFYILSIDAYLKTSRTKCALHYHR